MPPTTPPAMAPVWLLLEAATLFVLVTVAPAGSVVGEDDVMVITCPFEVTMTVVTTMVTDGVVKTEAVDDGGTEVALLNGSVEDWMEEMV